MRTLAVIAQKGGAGKTTLTRNIAVAAAAEGQRVLCIDLDPQQSLRAWWSARTAEQPAMLDTDPRPDELAALAKQLDGKIDLLVIDTPPAAPVWIADVLAVADLVAVPVRPSPDDLRAVGATIKALNATRAPFAFVMSQTPRARLTEEAARVLAQHGRVAPTNIAQRVSYSETAASGAGVIETKDSKAAAEIAAVWEYLKRIMQ